MLCEISQMTNPSAPRNPMLKAIQNHRANCAPARTATPTPVPLLDVSRQYQPLKQDIMAAITRVCDSGRFVLGPRRGRILGVLFHHSWCTPLCRVGGRATLRFFISCERLRVQPFANPV